MYDCPILTITARKAKENESISFSLTNIITTGDYFLNITESYYSVNYRIVNDIYYCDSIIFGKLTMTQIDTINRILSGTFYFDAVSDSLRYEIRNGRFDVKY